MSYNFDYSENSSIFAPLLRNYFFTINRKRAYSHDYRTR